jgi:hypothetical protein
VRLWSFHRASAVVASMVPIYPASSSGRNSGSAPEAAPASSVLSGEGLQELCSFSIFCSIGTTLLRHRLTVASSWGGQCASISAVARVVAAFSLLPSPSSSPSSYAPSSSSAHADSNDFSVADSNDFDTAPAPHHCNDALFSSDSGGALFSSGSGGAHGSGSGGAHGSAEVISLVMPPSCCELFVSVRRRDSSLHLLRFIAASDCTAAESFELASSRLIIRGDSGTSLVVLPIMGCDGGVLVRDSTLPSLYFCNIWSGTSRVRPRHLIT